MKSASEGAFDHSGRDLTQEILRVHYLQTSIVFCFIFFLLLHFDILFRSVNAACICNIAVIESVYPNPYPNKHRSGI
jgi:hypothetical protein